MRTITMTAHDGNYQVLWPEGEKRHAKNFFHRDQATAFAFGLAQKGDSVIVTLEEADRVTPHKPRTLKETVFGASR